MAVWGGSHHSRLQEAHVAGIEEEPPGEHRGRLPPCAPSGRGEPGPSARTPRRSSSCCKAGQSARVKAAQATTGQRDADAQQGQIRGVAERSASPLRPPPPRELGADWLALGRGSAGTAQGAQAIVHRADERVVVKLPAIAPGNNSNGSPRRRWGCARAQQERLACAKRVDSGHATQSLPSLAHPVSACCQQRLHRRGPSSHQRYRASGRPSQIHRNRRIETPCAAKPEFRHRERRGYAPGYAWGTAVVRPHIHTRPHSTGGPAVRGACPY